MWPTIWLSPDWCCVLHQPEPAEPFGFSHAGAANNLNAATQGVSNGHRLPRTSSNPLFLVRDYLPVLQERKKLCEIILWWKADVPQTKL